MKVKSFKYIFFLLLLIELIFGNSFLTEALATTKRDNQISQKKGTTRKETVTKSSPRSAVSKNKPQSKKSGSARVTSSSLRASLEQSSETIHIVKRGDTLYSIARKYAVSVDALKKANNLNSDRLQLGQKLIIPSRASLRDGSTSNLLARTQRFVAVNSEPRQEEQPRADSNYLYHTVQPGETLYRISLNYGVSLDEIRRLNNLEGNIISVGQKLKIPRNLQDPTKSTPSLERPLRDLRAEEETLQSKFEKNVRGKERILTPSMLSKEDELALKRKFVELSTYYADSRYRLGGNGDGYLDCSSFVRLVYSELGINLPRSSAQQFMVGIPVEEHELIPGDLVFFRTRGKTISHVGIYIGDNRFIHISSSRKRVAIDSLDDPYFRKRYAGAKRVLNGEVLEYFQDYLNKRESNQDAKGKRDPLS